MLSPQDPSAFRAEVLRRAVRLDRRRRRLRTLLVVTAVSALLLSATSVQLARSGRRSGGVDLAAGGTSVKGGVRVSVVDLPGLRTPWAAIGGVGRSVWVLDRGGDVGPVLRRFDDGKLRVNAQLPADAAPEQLAAGTDGGIWMTDPPRSRAFRVGADGHVASWPTGAVPSASATFARERLWFADRRGGRLTGLASDGTLVHLQLPEGAAPDMVAVAQEGSLWYGDAERATAGSVSPSGAARLWPLAAADERVVVMAVGPGSALWLLVRSDRGLRLGRADASGRIQEDDVDVSAAGRGMAQGPDGSLWLTSGDGSALLRRSLSGSSTSALEQPVKARSWALDAEGTMWAVDSDRGHLVEVSPAG